MEGFSQVTLIGNVGKKVEMSYTGNGTAVTKFSLAVNTKQNGKDVTNWYNVTSWRGQAEVINQHVKPGQQLFIQGELSPRQYTNRDGQPAFSLDVTLDKFKFVGGKPSGAGQQSDDLTELDEHPF